MMEGGTWVAKENPLKWLKFSPHKPIEKSRVDARLISPKTYNTDNSQIVTHLVKTNLPYYYNYKI